MSSKLFLLRKGSKDESSYLPLLATSRKGKILGASLYLLGIWEPARLCAAFDFKPIWSAFSGTLVFTARRDHIHSTALEGGAVIPYDV